MHFRDEAGCYRLLMGLGKRFLQDPASKNSHTPTIDFLTSVLFILYVLKMAEHQSLMAQIR